MKKTDKITIDYIKKALKDIAELSNIHPQAVTLAQLMAYDEDITEWALRKFGGLSSIKKSFPLTSKDLIEIKNQKDIASYIRKLESDLADKESLEKDIRKAILDKIKPVKVVPYKPVKKKTREPRHVVAMLNDTHIGLKVDKKEVDNLNEFNFKIASRRIAFFVDQVCNYKKEKRSEVEALHFILNGDLIAGIIHGLQGDDLNMLTHQINGAIHIFTNVVSHLASNFKKVKVYFSTGNHGDSPHRREGGRVSSQIYDSLEGQIFYAVSVAHRNTKNVEFVAGHTLYQDIYLPAGRAAFTHGHLLFSKQLGNPGSTVNTKQLGVAVSDFNLSQQRMGKEPIQLWLLGHTHCHFHITTKTGVQIYNAPSLSGIDSFAYSIGIHHNLTAQVVFESTKKYIMGDVRLVHVQEADKKKQLDKIILSGEIKEEIAVQFIKNIRLLDYVNNNDITVLINTPGGCIHQGLAIIDAIRECKSKVITHAVGPCWSMGACILQAGDERLISANATIMIHAGQIILPEDHVVNVDRWHREYKRINKVYDEIIFKKIKEKRPRFTEKKLTDIMKFDTIYTAEQAIAMGLADKVEEHRSF